MLHKEFFGLLFLAFVGWIFVAGTPTDRIDHFCRPISWTGNVVVSMSALVLPKSQTTVQGYFDKVDYGCQYMTWRLFYQSDYNAWRAAQNLPPAPAMPSFPKVPASAAASAPAAPAKAPMVSASAASTK